MNLGITNLDLYLTGACNYKCEYCYGENECNSHMKIETYKKCLEFAKYIGAETIQHCGGEPLLVTNFADYVELAKAEGFKQVLRTNGIYVSNYAELIAKEFDWVGISLDGMMEVNAKMRPSKVEIEKEKQFGLPIEAIWELKRLNPELKIILATVASKRNYKDIPELYRYIKESKLPIDRWKIYQFIRDKFRSDINFEKYEMTQEMFSELEAIIPKRVNENVEIILQSAFTEGVSGNCLIVFHDGSIVIQKKHYGNINTDNFDEIVTKLLKGNVISQIKSNKVATYGDR